MERNEAKFSESKGISKSLELEIKSCNSEALRLKVACLSIGKSFRFLNFRPKLLVPASVLKRLAKR